MKTAQAFIKIGLVAVCLVIGLIQGFATNVSPPAKEVGTVLGLNHEFPLYSFNSANQDVLNEGASGAIALGSNAIKLWVNINPQNSYPDFSTNKIHPWSTYATPLALIQSPYFASILSNPSITTYVLELYQFESPPSYPIVSLSSATAQYAYSETNALAEYLIQTYAGTGKTFIIENWEGDNHLAFSSTTSTANWGVSGAPGSWTLTTPVGTAVSTAPFPSITNAAVPAFLTWIGERQLAVHDARVWATSGGRNYTNVNVFNSCEVCLLPLNAADEANYTNASGTAFPLLIDMVGYASQFDLYAYSCWQALYPTTSGMPTNQEPPSLLDRMVYMQTHVPIAGPFGAQDYYVGEYGSYEDMWFANTPSGTTTANKNHHDSHSDAVFQLEINQETDYLLRANPKFMFFWELYGDGIRSDSSSGDAWKYAPTLPAPPSPVTSTSYYASPFNLSEEYITGTWLIRPPGLSGGVTDGNDSPAYVAPTPTQSNTMSYTGAYSYLADLAPENFYWETYASWTYVNDHTTSAIIDFSSPSWCEGDASRMYCSVLNPSLSSPQYYDLYFDKTPSSPNPSECICDWRIKAFVEATSATDAPTEVNNQLQYETSADGVTWNGPYTFNEVANDVEQPDTSKPWYRLYLTPSTLPSMQKYLRIMFDGPQNSSYGLDDLEIGYTQVFTNTNTLDELANNSILYTHSSGVTYTTSTQIWDDGDTNRAYRTDGNAEYIIYKFAPTTTGFNDPVVPAITNFDIKVFMEEPTGYTPPAPPAPLASVGSRMTYYTSTDDVNWNGPYTFTDTRVTQPAPSVPWFEDHLIPSAPIAANQYYLKIQWGTPPLIAPNDIEIGSVEVSTP